MVPPQRDPVAKIANCPPESISLRTRSPSMHDPQTPLQPSVTCDQLLAKGISDLASFRPCPQKEGQCLLLPSPPFPWQGHAPDTGAVLLSTSRGTEERHHARGEGPHCVVKRADHPPRLVREKFPFCLSPISGSLSQQSNLPQSLSQSTLWCQGADG